MIWFKWHITNLKWKIKDIFGTLKKDAREAIGQVVEDAPIGLENQIGEDYRELRDAPVSLKWFNIMNGAALLMILSVMVIILCMFISPPRPIIKDYLFRSAIGLFFLMLVFFIFAALQAEKIGRIYTLDEDEKKRAEKWLNLVGEEDRETMPLWAWILLIIFLAVESSAIITIVAPYIADLPQKYIIIAGILIGVAAGAVLGIFVHVAGKSLYKIHKQNSLVDRMVAEVEHHDRRPPSSSDRISRCYYSNLYKNLRDIEHPGAEEIESSEIHDAIMATRRGFLMRYRLVLLTWAIVIAIAILAFYQRAKLNEGIIENQKIASGDILMERMLPEETLKAMQKTEKEEIEKEISRAIKQMYAALAILTLLYILANILGTYLGYKYSFFCNRSEQFYRIKKEFEEREEWRNKVELAANKVFAKYYYYLMREIPRDLGGIEEVLMKRGRYTLKRFINYRRI
ncbi:MAG: hypothetical protein DRP29_00075 [Thermodesulfobacteriota bacterium]|nr:MAG: hypothetical protein DRP29_00075 [Thermodesulfobacteriota bacterium]